MNHDHKDGKSCCSGLSAASVFWWAKLTVAVLAIPSLGIILALGLSQEPVIQVAILILTCWACVFYGMKLMRDNSK